MGTSGRGSRVCCFLSTVHNLGTNADKIVRNAGWSRGRSSSRTARTRATELVAAGWPEYKVCKWLGHTEVIARRHYWQVTDDDSARRLACQQRGPNRAKSMQQCGEKPCKAVQDSQAVEHRPVGKTPELRGFARKLTSFPLLAFTICNTSQWAQVDKRPHVANLHATLSIVV